MSGAWYSRFVRDKKNMPRSLPEIDPFPDYICGAFPHILKTQISGLNLAESARTCFSNFQMNYTSKKLNTTPRDDSWGIMNRPFTHPFLSLRPMVHSHVFLFLHLSNVIEQLGSPFSFWKSIGSFLKRTQLRCNTVTKPGGSLAKQYWGAGPE